MKTGDEKVALRLQGGFAANGVGVWRFGKALTFGTGGAGPLVGSWSRAMPLQAQAREIGVV